MDKLTSPKFKSRVEQFYYENGANSELDLTGGVDEVFSGEQESPRGRNVEKLRLEEARRRAYSGERRGVCRRGLRCWRRSAGAGVCGRAGLRVLRGLRGPRLPPGWQGHFAIECE